MAAGRKRKGDAELVLALACGASPEVAAQKAGLSRRTAYRRLADPAFRARVTGLQAEIVGQAAGMITAAALGAVKALTALQGSAASEAVRLGAARATLELGCKLRESAELLGRVAAVEGRVEALLAGAGRPGDAAGPAR